MQEVIAYGAAHDLQTAHDAVELAHLAAYLQGEAGFWPSFSLGFRAAS